MGTPRYMAPEQLERPQEVDHRADIFSLGVVLYEMLTGQVPAGVIEPPSRKVAVDVRLDEVVLRTLQREPERRYQSASDLEAGVKGAGRVQARTRGPAVDEPGPVPGGPVRVGFTLADLVAVAVLPVSMFAAALSLSATHGMDGSRGSRPASDVVAMFVFTGVLWWVLPLATAAHTALGRRREGAVRVSMPLLRTGWALTLFIATLAIAAVTSTIERYGSDDVRVIVRAQGGAMLALALLAAALGAWNRKGAHRRLVGERMQRALAGLTAALAGVAALAGLVATFSGSVPLAYADSIFGESLALTVQLPLIAAGVVAATMARSGPPRLPTFVLACGASVTLLDHLMGSVRYGSSSGPVLGCLVGAVLLGFITTAGTAEPLAPRRRTTHGAVASPMRWIVPMKLALGLVTVAPLATLAVVVTLILSSPASPGASPGDAATDFAGMIAPLLFAVFATVPLLVFYIWHATTRAAVDHDSTRLIWALLLFFAAPFTMPVYWFVHVWRRRTPAAASH